MDRLPALIACLALAACESKSSTPEPSRVNAAKTAKKTDAVASFCDVRHDRETAPKLEVPPLVDGTLAAPAGKWRWLNVWATWCKPCVEEIPRIVKWRDKLGVDLAFVSVDESADDLAAYRKLHPETPASPRLAKPDGQGAWYAALGLDAGAPIPIHVFVDPDGRVRCVRAGGVREQDFDAIAALLR